MDRRYTERIICGKFPQLLSLLILPSPIRALATVTRVIKEKICCKTTFQSLLFIAFYSQYLHYLSCHVLENILILLSIAHKFNPMSTC